VAGALVFHVLVFVGTILYFDDGFFEAADGEHDAQQPDGVVFGEFAGCEHVGKRSPEDELRYRLGSD